MLIRKLLSKNIAFAVYRIPREKTPMFVVQTTPVQKFVPDTLDEQSGFVIAPFDAYKSGNAFLIKPEIVAGNLPEYKELSDYLDAFSDKDTELPHIRNVITTKEDYLQQVAGLVARIKNGEARKVVLSRVRDKMLPTGFSPDLFFELLQQSYPNAFVYLFYLPGNGIWAGATPETLLKKEVEYFETMALAGTQKLSGKNGPVPWEKKEKEEQAFVSVFVEEQIKKTGIKTYEKQPAETILAGRLAHICTRFRFPAETLKGKTGRFVNLLHPTPAVCGLPKEAAWQLIGETENHQRRFYTGFIGPWQVRGTSKLFVNLRCAEFTEKKMLLYTGGGLTADSNPEKEWQETEDKSATLLSVVEKMRNFAP